MRDLVRKIARNRSKTEMKFLCGLKPNSRVRYRYFATLGAFAREHRFRLPPPQHHIKTMPLVDYSSDSSADTPPDTPKPKDNKPAQDLPPLPALFHTLYPTAPRRSTTDDPSLHDNRQRQIPHLPGYYPTHAYLECKIPVYLLTYSQKDVD